MGEAIAWIIIGSVSAVLLLGLMLVGCSYITCRPSRAVSDSEKSSTSFNKGQPEQNGCEQLVHFEGGEGLTVDDILNASGEVLGKSSYGTVYKARLQRNGGMIALRLFRDGCIRRSEEFVSGIQELGLIRHSHLLVMQAFYAGPSGENLVIYDYIARGNLEQLLYNRNRAAPGWSKLHRIALGAARGLAYLHSGLQTPIIHGNLKTKNILIDENYEAHLSDFGFHELMNQSSKIAMLEASASQGYLAPEVLKLKKPNTKSDTYSFGIILLEILIGRRPDERDSANQIVDLPMVVKNFVLEERISELFSPAILGGGTRSPTEEGLLRVLQLAMGCCAPSPSVRPDMREVVRQLEKICPAPLSPTYGFSPQYTSDDRSSREFVL
ncbi:hypothetical protein SUGI_0455110 [Cryptomeria japonica]|uniref:putative kinase-like protein TMKL1 n=1 Tax=Cryptomeria japonica TaxID=3369 RepID=UPI0024089F52|nr:putative kinase-like protein TMKL1 [Cryptomeria japonica]GLJ23941.1 hypothetical protein SUGI_0455110 [Cryptomeria japonica]